jgi:O-antigen/teichoic acid export membrane protein
MSSKTEVMDVRGDPGRALRLGWNFVVLSGGEVVGKGLTLLAFAYLARVLGPAEFGGLEFALAMIVFFTLFVDCGLSPYGAREVAKDEGSVRTLAAHIVAIRLVVAGVAFALLGVIVALLDKPWSWKALLLLYGVTLFELPGMLGWVFQGCDLMRYVAVASVTRWAVFAGGVLLLVRRPEHLWIVPLIEVGAIGAAVAFYLRAFTARFGSLGLGSDRGLVVSMLRRALPIGGSELVWACKTYLATVLLGVLAGAAEVGWFGGAHRVVVAAHAFVWLYFFNLLPSLARSTRMPLDELRSLMARSIRVTAWGAVIVGTLGTALAPEVIGLIYGPAYAEAGPVLRILIWLIPLTLVSGHYRYALIGYDRQTLEFVSTACGAGLNVVLNLLWIPRYGIEGAAWALVLSEILIWGLSYYFVRRTVAHIPCWRDVARPVASGAVVGIALYLLPVGNLWLAGAAVLAYALAASLIQPTIVPDIRAMFAGGPRL